MHELLTPAVLAAERHYYGRPYAPPAAAPEGDALGAEEVAFIESRDSFYLGTVSESGWPYLQHRGGAPGFLQVLGPRELAFADYRGNRQLLSTGNLAVHDRVCLFLMDYPNRERLKILGHAEVVDARDQHEWVARLAAPEVAPLVERIFRVRVVGFDWNCPKYITPRFTVDQVEALVAPLKARIAELEAQRNSKPSP